MANTGIIDGGDLMLYVKVGEVWTMIGEAKSHSLSLKGENRVTRTKSTGKFPSRKYGTLDANASTDNLVTYDGYGYYELMALLLAQTKVVLKLAGHSDTDLGVIEVVGDKYLEGTYVIDSVDLNAADGEDASFTCAFSIDGELEIKTVTL